MNKKQSTSEALCAADATRMLDKNTPQYAKNSICYSPRCR
jgi:hypothetical protein